MLSDITGNHRQIFVIKWACLQSFNIWAHASKFILNVPLPRIRLFKATLNDGKRKQKTELQEHPGHSGRLDPASPFK